MQSGQSPEPSSRGPHRIAARDGAGHGARTRIQTVALELFTDQGYDRTSLREIADRLGVTKAALYYHFPTKEDIVESLVSDRLAEIDALIAWLREQPRNQATRREFIRRYANDLYHSRHCQVMRFFERNQSSMNKLPSGIRMRDRMLTVIELLTDPSAQLTDRIRSSMAIVTLHASWFVVQDGTVSDEQRRDASIAVALDLIGD